MSAPALNTEGDTGARAGDGNLPPLPEPEGACEIDCGPAPGGGREVLYVDGYSADQMRAYALAALASAPAVSAPAGWQPIETAPKDGSDILLYCPDGHILTAGWSNMGWTDNARGSWWGFDATHWMPLPAAPGFEAPVTGEQP